MMIFVQGLLMLKSWSAKLFQVCVGAGVGCVWDGVEVCGGCVCVWGCRVCLCECSSEDFVPCISISYYIYCYYHFQSFKHTSNAQVVKANL